jgi:CBS domain-containing protein
MSVADASQLCAAKRTDCVLVVDDEEGLSGIFTAKDLAFRVTADGLDPRTTSVSQIMTRNPMVTRDTTSATEALQLMVSRHFRHLPVCNEDGDVVGLLDITKVFHDALSKVERSADATSQLSAALAGVQSEFGNGLGANPQAAAMMAYVDALRDRMAQPDLMSVIDTSLPPPTVSPRTSVREAARLMKERRTTAVCVLEANHGSMISGASNRDQPPKIAGIFTSKDIVLRVIAAGLDASRCSVVRVMTPHPDTAPPMMTVQDALKKMHNGHYLNLPVVDDDGRLMGIVDVLKLTYATLEQIEQMNEDKGSEGPMWGKFFDTLNSAVPEEDSVSGISSHEPRSESPSKSLHVRGMSSVTSPMSEVMPGDSASLVGESMSDVGGQGSSLQPIVAVEDGTYVFKFKTPSGKTHRFQARHDNFELLRDIVHGKLSADPFFDTPSDPEAYVPDPLIFALSYTDDDGDLVEMTADGDVEDAVRIARGQRCDRVVLNIDGGKNWEDARPTPEPKIETVVVKAEPKLAYIPEEEPKQEDAALFPPPVAAPKPAARQLQQEELVFGVLPKDLALPAAIGFLGIVIAGVFVASRTSK